MNVNASNNNHQSVSFGRLTRDNITMTKDMFKIVSDMPVVKTFGQKFNARVTMDSFLSSRPGNRPQMALTFTNVRPKTLFGKLKALINHNKTESIMLKTRATNIDDFYASLANKPKDALLKIYNKKR